MCVIDCVLFVCVFVRSSDCLFVCLCVCLVVCVHVSVRPFVCTRDCLCDVFVSALVC